MKNQTKNSRKKIVETPLIRWIGFFYCLSLSFGAVISGHTVPFRRLIAVAVGFRCAFGFVSRRCNRLFGSRLSHFDVGFGFRHLCWAQNNFYYFKIKITFKALLKRHLTVNQINDWSLPSIYTISLWKDCLLTIRDCYGVVCL